MNYIKSQLFKILCSVEPYTWNHEYRWTGRKWARFRNDCKKSKILGDRGNYCRAMSLINEIVEHNHQSYEKKIHITF